MDKTMDEYFKRKWDLKSEDEKNYIKNKEKLRIQHGNDKEKYVDITLPINSEELFDLWGDILGRDKEGNILNAVPTSLYYINSTHFVRELHFENLLSIWYHKIKEPPYRYGKNPDVTWKNGEIYKKNYK